MKNKKKNKKWISKRHSFVIKLLYLPFLLYIKLRYHAKIEKYKGDYKGPILVLFNHQTAFDQFFVSISFPRHIYYVASEDLFSKGWLSKLISWLVNPIPFCKATADVSAVMRCVRIAREGGSIGMAPEGNRTFSGTTEHINPTVAAFIKAMKLPLVLYRIEGGYGVQPRWSRSLRKGKMRTYISRILSPEEYKAMSNEELLAIVEKELYVDEREDKTLFFSKKSAEYLERAMYVCPFCGLSEFESRGNIITCKRCHRQIRYLPSKQLEGVGFTFPHRYVKDWYDAQSDFVRALDLMPYSDTPIYTESVSFCENIYCKRKIVLYKKAFLSIYANRFHIVSDDGETCFSFADISATAVIGKNKLNIYVDTKIYQISGNERFNALKYVNIYYHAANLKKGIAKEGFLGL